MIYSSATHSWTSRAFACFHHEATRSFFVLRSSRRGTLNSPPTRLREIICYFHATASLFVDFSFFSLFSKIMHAVRGIAIYDPLCAKFGATQIQMKNALRFDDPSVKDHDKSASDHDKSARFNDKSAAFFATKGAQTDARSPYLTQSAERKVHP